MYPHIYRESYMNINIIKWSKIILLSKIWSRCHEPNNIEVCFQQRDSVDGDSQHNGRKDPDTHLDGDFDQPSSQVSEYGVG